jgi:hypothetical protein
VGSRIDLPENYAVGFARQAVRNSLQSHGEEVVLLSCYHINADYGSQPRCPECYDDLYQAGEKNDCPTCYGTTFLGGIKDVHRAWAIFTDAADQEDHTKRGVWHPIKRNVHTEYTPDIMEHDFIVRVTSWSTDYRPQGVEGIYVCDVVTNESLRTGNRPGQITLDAVGQRADVERLSEQMPIYRYPIVGTRFERADATDVVESTVSGVPLKTFNPSVTSGIGPPIAIAAVPGTLYIDTVTGDVYQWD